MTFVFWNRDRLVSSSEKCLTCQHILGQEAALDYGSSGRYSEPNSSETGVASKIRHLRSEVVASKPSSGYF